MGINKLEIVSVKDMVVLFGVSENTASYMRRKARKYYGLTGKAKLTIGQIIKSNNLQE